MRLSWLLGSSTVWIIKGRTLGLGLLLAAGLFFGLVGDVQGTPAGSCASATITWTGQSGNPYWYDGSNWDTGVPPVATDVVCIPAGTPDSLVYGNTYMVQSIENRGRLRIYYATLEVTDSATPSLVGDLTLDDGSRIGGAGNVVVEAGRTLHWQSGDMFGSGVTTVDPGGTLDSGDGYYRYLYLRDGHRLVNQGTLRIGSSSGYYAQLLMDNGTSLDNEGTIELVNASYIYRSGSGTPAPEMTNDGTLTKTGGGASYINVPMSGTGTVHVSSGDLYLDSEGPIGGGTFRVDAGQNLRFQRDVVVADPSALEGAGNYVVSNNATVTFEAGGDLPNLTIDQGTIRSSVDLIVPSGKSFHWLNGNLTGPGTTTVDPGGTLDTGDGYYRYLYLRDGHRLVNRGTMRLGSTSGYYSMLSMDDGTTLDNEGMLELQREAYIQRSGGGASVPELISSGTIDKTGGGTSYINVRLHNAGPVHVSSGDLNLGSVVGGAGGGTFQVDAGQNLRFQGDVQFADPAVLQGEGNYVVSNNATATFEAGGDLPNLTIDQGTIRSSVDLVVPSGKSLHWLNGNLTGTGTTTVDPGGTLDTGDGYYRYLYLRGEHRLVNRGTMRLGSTNGYYSMLYMDDGTTLDNQGTLELQSSSPIQRSGGGLLAPELINAGTLNKTNGGSSYVNVPMSGTGLVSIAEGSELSLPNYSGFDSTTGTLMAGRWMVAGTLRVTGLDIVNNAADLTLSNGYRLVDESNRDALRNFAENTEAGSLSLISADLTARTSVVNAGELSIGENSTLTTLGTFRQVSGSLLLKTPTSVVRAESGSAQLFGGVVSGVGTIEADVMNAAVLSPGDPIGILHIDGSLTQTGGGTLVSDIAGRVPGTRFDQLDVSGTVSLDGALRAVTASDFQPRLGDLFLLVDTPSTLTGVFATFEGAEANGRVGYLPIYDPQGVVLKGVVHVATTLEATAAVATLPDAPGRTPALEATLTETASGQPIAGKEVRFTTGSEVVCVAVTDALGTARCTSPFQIAPAVAAQGYTACFLGAEEYLGSCADGRIARSAGVEL
ncbi:MAG: hypothetical protein ACT452_04545 [Microthrixaceae bacterium]